MTVVNLGDLPSNAPLPNGRGDGFPLGTASGGEWTYNNTVPAQNLIGGWSGIGITPTRDCMWHVMANTVWRGPDDVWTGSYWGIHLNQPDLNGIQDFVAMNWCHAGTVDWQAGVCEGTYRLQAGVYYTAYTYWFGSAVGWNQVTYATYCNIHGHVLSEACI